jgi:hypothetical protein
MIIRVSRLSIVATSFQDAVPQVAVHLTLLGSIIPQNGLSFQDAPRALGGFPSLPYDSHERRKDQAGDHGRQPAQAPSGKIVAAFSHYTVGSLLMRSYALFGR